MFVEVNYLPSSSRVKPNKMHYVNYLMTDYKRVSSIFIEWKGLSKELFKISQNANTLRNGDRATFWLRFVKIGSIYEPYEFAWNKRIFQKKKALVFGS